MASEPDDRAELLARAERAETEVRRMRDRTAQLIAKWREQGNTDALIDVVCLVTESGMLLLHANAYRDARAWVLAQERLQAAAAHNAACHVDAGSGPCPACAAIKSPRQLEASARAVALSSAAIAGWSDDE